MILSNDDENIGDKNVTDLPQTQTIGDTPVVELQALRLLVGDGVGPTAVRAAVDSHLVVD